MADDKNDDLHGEENVNPPRFGGYKPEGDDSGKEPIYDDRGTPQPSQASGSTRRRPTREELGEQEKATGTGASTAVDPAEQQFVRPGGLTGKGGSLFKREGKGRDAGCGICCGYD